MWSSGTTGRSFVAASLAAVLGARSAAIAVGYCYCRSICGVDHALAEVLGAHLSGVPKKVLAILRLRVRVRFRADIVKREYLQAVAVNHMACGDAGDGNAAAELASASAGDLEYFLRYGARLDRPPFANLRLVINNAPTGLCICVC